MFQSQTNPGGGGDIRSAISVMRQRLGKPGASAAWLQKQGGPQGIDPSQVTTQGGQQGIVGRGGNFQALGAAAQGRLAAQQPATASTSAPQDTPEMTDFMAKNPGLTPDFIRNAAAQNGGTATGQVGGAAPGVGKNFIGGVSASPPQTQGISMEPSVGGGMQQIGGGPPVGMSRSVDAPAGGGLSISPNDGAPMELSAPGAPPMPQPFAPGAEFLTPEQMARGAAGAQGGGGTMGIGMPGGGAGAGRSFADFWQRNGGGAGGSLPPALLQRLQAMRSGRKGNPYRSLVSGALGAQGGM